MITILIYIPCYIDYKLAIESIRAIRLQQEQLCDDKKFKILIVLSINGVLIPKADLQELSKLVDKLKYFSNSIGGDTNILQGFLEALEIEPNYFWILSANEKIKTDALNNLIDLVSANENVDLFIGNTKREILTSPKCIFTDFKDSSIGLISSTIYNFSSTNKHYPVSSKFNWSGWGHLAVIESFLLDSKEPLVYEFFDSKLYNKPFIFSDMLVDEEVNSIFVRNNYRNSFFSYLVVADFFHGANRKIMKKIVNLWFKKNWYKLNFFYNGSKTDQFSNTLITFFMATLKKLNIFYFLVFKIFLFVPFEKLNKIELFKNLLAKYKITFNTQF